MNFLEVPAVDDRLGSCRRSVFADIVFFETFSGSLDQYFYCARLLVAAGAVETLKLDCCSGKLFYTRGQ